MADQWIVRRDGKNSAPIPDAKLRILAANGKLKPTDLLRSEGMDRFVLAGDIEGLFPTEAPAPVESPLFIVTTEDDTAPARSRPRSPQALAAALLALPWPWIGLGATALTVTTLAGVMLTAPNRDRPQGPTEGVTTDAKSAPNQPLGIARTDGKSGAEQQSRKVSGVRSSLTADEIELLKWASSPDPPIVTMTNGRMTFTPRPGTRELSLEEKLGLLARQIRAGGRGRRLALSLLAREVYIQAYNQEASGFDKSLAGYPVEMRKLAFKVVGMALKGEEIPPPFTDEFRSVAGSSTGWFDRLRASKAMQNELRLSMTKVHQVVTLVVDEDFGPVLGKAPIPAEVLLVRPSPGGQDLTIKYVGTEPLTNVVMFSKVKQNGRGAGGTRVPRAAIYGINRAFATKDQADDAQRILVAHDAYARMPKYSSKYVATLSPGDTIGFVVGYMERGAAAEGNTNSLALFCDQGQISRRGSDEFPELPAPVRPRGPNDAKTLVLDENGTVKVEGAFASSNRSTTRKRKGDTVEQVFLIDLKAGTTYTFTLQYSDTAAAPNLGISFKHFPDIRSSKPNPSTVIRELHAQAGRYQVHCLCPVDDLGRFTLTIREGAAPIAPTLARKAAASKTPIRARKGR